MQTKPEAEEENPMGLGSQLESHRLADGPPPPEETTGSTLQAKLKVGAPGDRFERQADAVADQVVQRLESPSGARPEALAVDSESASGSEEEELRRQPESEKGEEDLPLQAQRAGAEGTGSREATPSFARTLEQSRHSGDQAMSPAVQKEMEGAFGADFSGVRLHTGDSARSLSGQLNARAFTRGEDIFFNRGEYRPGTHEGQRLLAHELTHVVQQGDGGKPGLVQRQEQAEAAETELAPVTPEVAREFLEDTIRFWDEGRKHLPEVTLELLPTLLGNWLRMMNSGWRLIDEHLDGDEEMLNRLKESYRASVSALIGRASGDLAVSEQELYAQHNLRIAWWLRRKVASREDIVFILGSSADKFYGHAIKFYEFSRARIIGDLRSLREVRDWLAANPPANGLPWGDVNVVSHATFEGTMAVPVVPGGKKVTPNTLRTAIERQEFRPLPDEIVDGATRIVIRGCALGRNQEILELLRSAFGGNEESPQVYAPKYLQNYEYWRERREGEAGEEITVEAVEYLEEFWYVGYPEKESAPTALNEARLTELFAAKYPSVRVDWRAMLGTCVRWRKQLGTCGATTRTHLKLPEPYPFRELYKAPPRGAAGADRLVQLIKAETAESAAWTDIKETSRQMDAGLITIKFSFRDGAREDSGTIPNLMPEVRTQREYRDLLNLQDDLLAYLRTLEEGSNLSADDFHWTLERVPYEGAPLTADYNFTGERGRLRIHRELLEPVDEGQEGPSRVRPDISNPKHFSRVGPTNY